MTDHELTITPMHARRIKFIGTCDCGNFRFTAPPDILREFHAVHCLFPDTALFGTAS